MRSAKVHVTVVSVRIVVLSNVTPSLDYWLSASLKHKYASTHVGCPRYMLAHSCDICCKCWLVMNYVFRFCLFHAYISSIDMVIFSILSFRAVTPHGGMCRFQCFGRTHCLQRKGSYRQNIIFITKAMYIHRSNAYAFH